MTPKMTREEIEAACKRLETIWPEYFEGVMTRAGLRWSELVVAAVVQCETPWEELDTDLSV